MSNSVANEEATNKPDRFLRLPEVIYLCGLPRASIYEQMALGTFPRPVALTTRTRGWRESEIRAWMDERVRARSTG